MSKITKEDYLRLLDAVLKEQKEEELEINADYLDKQEVTKQTNKFMYVDGQGKINATILTREEFNNTWHNQGNIFIGNFLIKIGGFSLKHFAQLNIYDYNLDDSKNPFTTKIDIFKDIRFELVEWKPYYDPKRMNSFIHIEINKVFDVVEWLQRLDKLAAFV